MLTRGYYTCGCSICRGWSQRASGGAHGRKARRTKANRTFRHRSKAQVERYLATFTAEYAYDADWESGAYGAGYWD